MGRSRYSGFSKSFLEKHMRWGTVGRNRNAIRKPDAVRQMMELQESDQDGRVEIHVDYWGPDRPFVLEKTGNKVVFTCANGLKVTRYLKEE